MTATDEQNTRYLASKCVDCGGKPSAGRPRCAGCHDGLMRARNEGRAV